ncbi:CUL9 [Acrasis kona]|uniref:CUL9 n=1 Tax=Acrasis kona TaxID=1008807 RepID=A0AAW2Z4Y3_9EUKA
MKRAADTVNSGTSRKKCKIEFIDEDAKECEGCTDPSTVDLPGCKHTYCNSCFVQSFKSAIELGNYHDKICCEPLPESMIKEHLPDKLCEEYFAAKERSKHLKRTCVSCQVDIFIPADAVESGEFSCECGTKICIQCNKLKHDGECTYSDTEIMLKDLAKQSGWAKCPHCGFTVEKIKGCCYMKCACKAEFCNRCSRPWKRAENQPRHHRCHYCSQVVIGIEFEEDEEEEEDNRQYSYRILGRLRAVPIIGPSSVLAFLDKADKWVQEFVPKKGKHKTDIPITGLIMRKDELKILPGSKKISAGTIDRVKEELIRAREEHAEDVVDAAVDVAEEDAEEVVVQNEL